MSRKRKKEKRNEEEREPREPIIQLRPDTRKSIGVVTCIGVGVLFILAAAGQAGPAGFRFFSFMQKLFGFGYYLLPLVSFLFAFSFFAPERKKLIGITFIGSVCFVLSGLGFIDIISPDRGGLTGRFIGALEYPFGVPASLVITFAIMVIALLLIIDRPLKLSLVTRVVGALRRKESVGTVVVAEPVSLVEPDEQRHEPATEVPPEPRQRTVSAPAGAVAAPKQRGARPMRNYVPPPLSLLASAVDKPTAGDLQANANIVRRTLESFGIPVEMGEINVGPTVTRYTLKPAEGVKLSKITTLSQDLALALAAHPIRIEAPIPGKSLVGIEVPNKAAAVVRLGSLLRYPESERVGPLAFALGRDVQGEPIFPNIDRMPHLLVAGATGSGKSIAIHSLVISLLYKNSPEMLNLIMIDPKRVELSIYDGLPHLIAPVVTDNKHAIGALRWVIQEMDRRYQLLLERGARDIGSYNASSQERLSFIVIVIDELADLMATYGHEVEGSIIRLAQMARATGVHLVVSTQRPSVEVITGLIKANITTRIALQVASQVDSRTILDTAGAEKLLGRGDLLFVSAELSKPRRLQGSFVTEGEIKSVVDFIKKNNEAARESITIEAVNGVAPDEGDENTGRNGLGSGGPYGPEGVGLFEGLAEGEDDDELYTQAIEVVKAAKKASASLLQRRLKVGYARAARLLDMMEERGVIGPGEGAKPRDILLEE